MERRAARIRSARRAAGGEGARLVLLLCVLATTSLDAQEWPQFRGPTGQGHAPPDARVPLEWSETKNVAWRTRVPGIGWSSPVVGAGRVWMTTAEESGTPGRGPVTASLRVIAVDAATGQLVVNVEVFRVASTGFIHVKNSRASPTPVLAGDRVFVHFGADGTAALSTSGQILWKTRLPYESQHGNGGSPVVWNDLVIVNCDGDDEAYVVALDAATGKTRWKSERRRPYAQAYTTPLLIRTGEREQLVSVGAYRAAAYDPGTGRELWRVSYDDGFSNVPRPVFGHGLVYIVSGWTTPPYLLAVRPDGEGDVTRTHVAWTLRRAVPYIVSPILVGDELYVLDDGGILTCVDAKTGNTVWMQRLQGNFSASPVYAAGRIYLQSEEGVTVVIAPGRQFRQLASNRLDGDMLASMAVAGNAVFIRTNSHLYRIEER